MNRRFVGVKTHQSCQYDHNTGCCLAIKGPAVDTPIGRTTARKVNLVLGGLDSRTLGLLCRRLGRLA
jgi:hypothetical protein